MLSSRRSKAAAGLHRAPVSPADRSQRSRPPARDARPRTPVRSARRDAGVLPRPAPASALHQTVLRLYRVILATCAFRVVTSVLALERLLPLHCARFLLNLA